MTTLNAQAHMIRSGIRSLYTFLFARPRLQWLNDGIIKLALHGKGFNNPTALSGEAWFVAHVLAAAKPRVCMDIGANQGWYTRLLLDRTEARVISAEPQPTVFSLLEAACRDRADRVTLLNCAVGDRSGTATLRYGSAAADSVLASLSDEISAVPYVRNDNRIEVALKTIDQIVIEQELDRLDFIKIDTEGFERNVLHGAATAIRTLRPAFIQVEYNWHHLFTRDSLWTLASLLPGYTPHMLLPQGWYKLDARDPVANIHKLSNIVFVRSNQL
ncbi:FkbM family methyltransferase [Limobrevibacterium gyesilva]|uniref:FkbM family methyltransferase n=1 Tax=Limobrevibacterium gyesilva TaxID=2991712 RepID=A0AA41YQL2_9PROT|nr:FkbM family methyltransferase [Limobrevibacterium gyesilva]MCW3473712.1 FkbM family methyltransferase [Limobrevibacterium gyesilva]